MSSTMPTCRTCQGLGKVPDFDKALFFGDAKHKPCVDCRGLGVIEKLCCPKCSNKKAWAKSINAMMDAEDGQS